MKESSRGFLLGIFLEKPRKTLQKLREDGRSPGRVSNPGHHKCKPLNHELGCSQWCVNCAFWRPHVNSRGHNFWRCTGTDLARLSVNTVCQTLRVCLLSAGVVWQVWRWSTWCAVSQNC